MTAPAAPRALRVDAQRNRDRVLAAAGELFGEYGAKASLEEIAGRAEVGVGTVYRHFPTKEDLIDAVVTEMQRVVFEAVDAALADPDPASALKTFLVTVTDLHARWRLLAEDMSNHVNGTADKDRFRAAVSDIVQRAQDAGAIRPDIGPSDVVILIAGIAHAASLTVEADPTLRHRYLTIVLDGLQPNDATPLPGKPLDLQALGRLSANPKVNNHPRC